MSLLNHFSTLRLTYDQKESLVKLEHFLKTSSQVFMLKGYAGSGKTTILKGFVDYLQSMNKEYLLMAPTGRAAKVLQERTGANASTIHKSIYNFDKLVELEEGDSFRYYFKLRSNSEVANKIFIVDESSMISDQENKGEFFQFGTGCLLSDLIEFTRVQHPGAATKLIFVGDPCQLPPVNDSSSKALNIDYLQSTFALGIEEVEMKEVYRQGDTSGIAKRAMNIRRSISSGYFNDFDLRENDQDIFNPNHSKFLNDYEDVKETKIIIAYKNKTCLDLNQDIRERKYGEKNLPVQKGDILIMGANNYRKGIYNGEFTVVNEVAPYNEVRTVYLKGRSPVSLSWRNIELVFPTIGGEHKIVNGKIIENFLYGDNYLRPEEMQALYVDFLQRHPDVKKGTEEFKEAILEDEYFNCLMVKYGYAVTCHKAQGGEWHTVFTVWDHENRENFNHLTDLQPTRGKTNESFYRWAYTAVTRASKKLYAVKPPYFTSYSKMHFIDEPVADSLQELEGNDPIAIEVELDNELTALMDQMNLFQQPVQLQDHFIKVKHATAKHFINIIGWERKNYEIWYRFLREEKQAILKTWIDAQQQFNNRYMIQAGKGTDPAFAKDVEEMLKRLPNITVKRNTSDTIISAIEFDIEVEEKLPFTRNLFDDLERILVGTGIIIDKLEHYEYRERFTFSKGGEKLVLDFEYDGKGFFGRILPVKNKTNNSPLLTEIKSLLTMLKDDHAS
jgi:tRNA A37 threonylcarbamoyladenosine biosynthesis protein TsaE